MSRRSSTGFAGPTPPEYEQTPTWATYASGLDAGRLARTDVSLGHANRRRLEARLRNQASNNTRPIVEAWVNQLLRFLDDSELEYWNYYCPKNWRKIRDEFKIDNGTADEANSFDDVLRAQIDNALQQDNGHELESRITNAVHAITLTRTGTSEGEPRTTIAKHYQVEELMRNWKLEQSVYAGRKAILEERFRDLFETIIPKHMQRDEIGIAGMTSLSAWSDKIERKIKKDERNIVENGHWYKIMAVLTFVKTNFTPHLLTLDAGSARVASVDLFRKMYPAEQVIVKMQLLVPPTKPTSRKPLDVLKKLKIFKSRRGGGPGGASSSASLARSSRARRYMNARQCQIYGL
ncbi:hypothetical protein JCM16303_004920 [Sporobolomyces ruberrimus]